MHAEVGRNRVEAAAVHDAGARFPGGLLVAVDHPPDPLRLAGQVAVVRARFGTGLDQRFAVQRVRPDGRDHDPRLAAERLERNGIARIGNYDRQACRFRSERAAQPLQLLLGTAGQRPLEAVVRPELRKQVAGEDLADETRRAEDGQVEGRGLHGQPRSAGIASLS
jgi:hypothetical protein